MPRLPFPDVTDVRRRTMSAIRSQNTGPEMVVRRLLRGMGYRYQVHRRDLPGKPDIVFPGRRRIVDVRGCFWHQHTDPRCRAAAAVPKTRSEFWRAKFEGNVARDRRNELALADLGWRTLVIWECEVGRPDLECRLRHFLGPPGAEVGSASRPPRDPPRLRDCRPRQPLGPTYPAGEG